MEHWFYLHWKCPRPQNLKIAWWLLGKNALGENVVATDTFDKKNSSPNWDRAKILFCIFFRRTADSENSTMVGIEECCCHGNILSMKDISAPNWDKALILFVFKLCWTTESKRYMMLAENVLLKFLKSLTAPWSLLHCFGSNNEIHRWSDPPPPSSPCLHLGDKTYGWFEKRNDSWQAVVASVLVESVLRAQWLLYSAADLLIFDILFFPGLLAKRVQRCSSRMPAPAVRSNFVGGLRRHQTCRLDLSFARIVCPRHGSQVVWLPNFLQAGWVKIETLLLSSGAITDFYVCVCVCVCVCMCVCCCIYEWSPSSDVVV